MLICVMIIMKNIITFGLVRGVFFNTCHLLDCFSCGQSVINIMTFGLVNDCIRDEPSSACGCAMWFFSLVLPFSPHLLIGPSHIS